MAQIQNVSCLSRDATATQAIQVFQEPFVDVSVNGRKLRLPEQPKRTAFRLKMRIARSKSLPRLWTRAGVRLIPEGHSANRSLSAIEPVSATAKRKLENGEQRPVPETFPARAEIPKITGQRLDPPA